MTARRTAVACTAAAILAVAGATAVTAACSIASSPCYPWRIESGQTDTVLLEIVPNNAPTSALYRVCLCPPTRSISLIFDFEGRQVTLGTI